jgi:transposase
VIERTRLPTPLPHWIAVTDRPAPRLRCAARDEIPTQQLSLDQLLTPDHPARAVWDFAQGLDLTHLYDRIRATHGRPGHPHVDPRILLALWLFATIDGVGTARELDRLCTSHTAYRWLCGGVSVNYHTLADFRVDHHDWLNELLTNSVAVLLHQNLVTLNRVAQDGMKVRASAGADTFRRQPTLERCLAQARQQVELLARQAGEGDAAVSQRQRAARRRAACEKAHRIQRALDQMPALRASREAFKRGTADQARASTTDPESRVMKMPDGGFRPAYNVQFATDAGSGLIVDATAVDRGTDNGLMGACVDRIAGRYGRAPREVLVDAGFGSLEDIDRVMQAHGTTTYAPVKNEKQLKERGEDPYAPREGDTATVREWRRRMGTESARAIYKHRSSSAEWVNAGCRNRGLYRLVVRGVEKVRCCALWQALAHNVMVVWRAATRQWHNPVAADDSGE